jgi:hypothetical protein
VSGKGKKEIAAVVLTIEVTDGRKNPPRPVCNPPVTGDFFIRICHASVKSGYNI